MEFELSKSFAGNNTLMPINLPGKSAWVSRNIDNCVCLCRVQHILGNLIMQLVLGIPLEMVHKGLRVGLVYLAGVTAG